MPVTHPAIIPQIQPYPIDTTKAQVQVSVMCMHICMHECTQSQQLNLGAESTTGEMSAA